MPKPPLLTRPSGLYLRFLVHPLHLPAGDVARLVAAHLGLALSQAFDALREGRPVDMTRFCAALGAVAGFRSSCSRAWSCPSGGWVQSQDCGPVYDATNTKCNICGPSKPIWCAGG